VISETQYLKEKTMKQRNTTTGELPEQIAQTAASHIRRRSFMKGLTWAGAGLLPGGTAFAQRDRDRDGDHKMRISDGDADILRFLAAAEILETDLWQQYTEFTSQEGPYTDALETIDDEMPSYISQNTNDEFSHQDFLNALLVKLHRRPVDLEQFRTLPSSPVAPVQSNRLTNLMHLNVDTSWYLRYRSEGNPDFGDTSSSARTCRPARSFVRRLLGLLEPWPRLIS
jgi:hypothetical protein